MSVVPRARTATVRVGGRQEPRRIRTVRSRQRNRSGRRRTPKVPEGPLLVSLVPGRESRFLPRLWRRQDHRSVELEIHAESVQDLQGNEGHEQAHEVEKPGGQSRRRGPQDGRHHNFRIRRRTQIRLSRSHRIRTGGRRFGRRGQGRSGNRWKGEW